MHPGLYVGEAVGPSCRGNCGDGFGGDVDLDVISVEVETISTYDITEWQDVNDEEEKIQTPNLGGRLVTKEQWRRCSY